MRTGPSLRYAAIATPKTPATAAGVFVFCAIVVLVMKAGIHPAYSEVGVNCACGHQFRTRSAHKGDIRVEICSHCHPFFTGRQKLVETEGRVDRFQKMLLKTSAIKQKKAEKN